MIAKKFLSVLVLAGALIAVPGTSAATLDGGFGTGGLTVIDSQPFKGGINTSGIVEVPGGGLRVFGQVNGDVGIFAFRDDGSLDTSFHGRGWKLSDPVAGKGANWDMPEDVAAVGNGQAVVAGGIDYVSAYASYQQQTLSKFNSAGELVKSFGDRGTVRVRSLQRALEVAEDSKGRLLTLSQEPRHGGSYSGKPLVPSKMKLARYTAGGRLDRSFGKKGIVTHTAPSGSVVKDLGVDDAGHPYVLVVDDNGTKKKRDRESLILRFTTTGRTDYGFGVDGKARSPLPNLRPESLAVLPDGSSLLAGSLDELHLFKLTPNGSLDRTYGENGVASLDDDSFRSGGVRYLTPLNRDGAVAMQWRQQLYLVDVAGEQVQIDREGLPYDGRGTLLAGSDGSIFTSQSVDATPVVGRLRPDHTVDGTFSQNALPQKELIFRQGRGLYGMGLTKSRGVASALDIGKSLYFGNPALKLTDRKGRVITDYGVDGTAPLEDNFDTSMGITPTRNGGLRVIGSNLTGGSKTVAQIDVSPAGKVDPGTLEDFKGGDYSGSRATADGGLVVFGSAFDKDRKEAGDVGFRVAKYHPDGSLDYKFGRYGVSEVFFKLDAVPEAVAFDRQGRIVLAGGNCDTLATCVGKGTTQKVSFARFRKNGKIDRSFGKNGKVQYRYGSRGAAYDVLTLKDGRIVATVNADCRDRCTNGLSLMALNANGSLDRKFGKRGRRTMYIGRSFEAITLFQAGRSGFNLSAQVETCRSNPSPGVIRFNRHGSIDRRFGGGDGLIRALPKRLLGMYPYYAEQQDRKTVVFGGSLDTKGRYGGAESATGLVRLNLRSKDGKASLRRCGV